MSELNKGLESNISPKKEEPKPEVSKKERPKSSAGYEGRRPNKVCNDGKDWKDFH